jgi:hypothetical protein
MKQSFKVTIEHNGEQTSIATPMTWFDVTDCIDVIQRAMLGAGFTLGGTLMIVSDDDVRKMDCHCAPDANRREHRRQQNIDKQSLKFLEIIEVQFLPNQDFETKVFTGFNDEGWLKVAATYEDECKAARGEEFNELMPIEWRRLDGEIFKYL